MEKKLQRSNLFKRVLSLVLAFVMLLSLVPMMPMSMRQKGTRRFT